MLKSADVFAEIASDIRRKMLSENKMHLGFAYGTNGALASELYLKCLLLVECGQVRKVHNLKKLFSQLSNESRHVLTERHEVLSASDIIFITVRKAGFRTDLPFLLDAGQDVFEQFRYPYEGLPEGIIFGLNLFGGCVRDRILDLRPDWISGESTSQAH
jgi:hypothetical protein